MRAMLFVIAIGAACGGSKTPATSPGSGAASASASDDDTLTETAPANDTPIHKRRNAACDKVGAKLAACAVEDTKNDKAHPPTADELRDLDKTAAIDKREYVKGCVAQEMSSRQVRVMEVCLEQATACEAFVTCLDNMKPQAQP